MPDSPLKFVLDSNVVIDLYVGSILQEALRHLSDAVIPDVIVEEELQEPSGRLLQQYGVRTVELSGEEVLEVSRLAARYKGPSRRDLFALVVARSRNAVLLTGDEHLREAAKQEGVRVHGTLWIADELVKRKRIVPKRAAEALEKMLAGRRRLPHYECEQRIRRWKNHVKRSIIPEA